MVERFFFGSNEDSNDHHLMLLSGPPSSGKTSLLFNYAYNVASNTTNNGFVFVLCKRQRLEARPPFLCQGVNPSSDVFGRIQMKYVDDDEGILKFFAAFHLFDAFPVAVVIDDFGDFFDDRKCQERYHNPRGRDMAMLRVLALSHNAIMHANKTGQCKLLLSDTHRGDLPRSLFIYKRWIPSIFTIKGDHNDSFILISNTAVRGGNQDRRMARYTLALQYLCLEEIIDDEELNKQTVIERRKEQKKQENINLVCYCLMGL